MKKMKTELHNNDEKIKEKYKRINNNNQINELKNNSKNFQKSQGKNPILRRLELKIDSNKNKNNYNMIILNKFSNKSNKIKNFISQEKNTINNEKTSSNENNYYNRKENNSLDNKAINKNIVYDFNNIEFKNDDNIEGYDFIIPDKYKLKNNGIIINSINTDGKIINIYENNKKEIIFQSGVRKEIFSDGYQLINFPNGDMKQKFVGEEEKVMYFYSETNTIQTSFKNGINVFKFNNGQIEKHYPDGSKYIFYSNGIRRKISKNGTEEDFIPEEH
jgi:centromere protein J